MKKTITFLLVFLLIISCRRGQITNRGPLFFNRALQDSLELYISQVPEIENPYHAPTIMDICIELRESNERSRIDTIVSVSAVYEVLLGPIIIDTSCFSGEDVGILLGACVVDGRICVVKKVRTIDVSSIIDEKCLTLPREEYDFFYRYEGPIYDVSISRSTREYQLKSNNQVALVGRTVGVFERSP